MTSHLNRQVLLQLGRLSSSYPFTTTLPALNCNQKRFSYMNQYKHGPYKEVNPNPPLLRFFVEFFKGGAVRWAKEEYKYIRGKFKGWKPHLESRCAINQTLIFEDFNPDRKDDELEIFKPVADSDTLDGFSKAYTSRSPDGHLVFSGYLNTEVPQNGLTQKSGFVALVGKHKRAFFTDDRYWDWRGFNTLEIRFKGDGRKYAIVLNACDTESDINFYDMFSYPLYTHGGPYWQTARIPFSKFIFNNKGFIQDEQYEFPVQGTIKFVAVVLSDQKTGPFRFEIDYMGLRNEAYGFEEITAYEQYTVPHLRFKQIVTDVPSSDDIVNRKLS